MSKEAMKLALEALESCGAGHISDGGNQWHDEKLVDKAITALREALAEQPAQQECRTDGRCQYAIDSGAEGMGHCPKGKCIMPAQEEPVAIIASLMPAERHTLLEEGHSLHDSLYTSPPAQRTWVGLTDVEWMNIVNKDQAWFGQRPDEVAHEVAKLVEAKLKEKNT